MTGNEIIANYGKPNSVALKSIDKISNAPRSESGSVTAYTVKAEVSRLYRISDRFEVDRDAKEFEGEEYWICHDLSILYSDAAEYLPTHVWGRF